MPHRHANVGDAARWSRSRGGSTTTDGIDDDDAFTRWWPSWVSSGLADGEPASRRAAGGCLIATNLHIALLEHVQQTHLDSFGRGRATRSWRRCHGWSGARGRSASVNSSDAGSGPPRTLIGSTSPIRCRRSTYRAWRASRRSADLDGRPTRSSACRRRVRRSTSFAWR